MIEVARHAQDTATEGFLRYDPRRPKQCICRFAREVSTAESAYHLTEKFAAASQFYGSLGMILVQQDHGNSHINRWVVSCLLPRSVAQTNDSLQHGLGVGQRCVHADLAVADISSIEAPEGIEHALHVGPHLFRCAPGQDPLAVLLGPKANLAPVTKAQFLHIHQPGLVVDLVEAYLNEVSDDLPCLAVGVEAGIDPATVDCIHQASVGRLEHLPPDGGADHQRGLSAPVVAEEDAIY